MNCKDSSEALVGARAIVPLAVGVLVYGLAFGVLASQAGFSVAQTGLMGAFVFAGSSQIVAVERLAADASVAAAVVAGMALNLRLLFVTASLRDLFIARPVWQQLIGAHLSTDENWALTVARRSNGQDVGFWFLVGAGGLLLLTWVFASVLGGMFASRIPSPETYAMDFAFTAAFIAISRSLWKGRAVILPWITAVAVVMGMTEVAGELDPSWLIVSGGLAGALVAGLSSSV